MENLTPHVVSAALRDQELEGNDLDFYLDLQSALEKLPLKNRYVLRFYMLDISPQEAVKKLGVKDNPQRLFNKSIRLLVGILNGSEDSITKKGV